MAEVVRIFLASMVGGVIGGLMVIVYEILRAKFNLPDILETDKKGGKKR